jgi:hypothetical protein
VIQGDAPLAPQDDGIDFARLRGAIRRIENGLRASSSCRKALLALNFSKGSPVATFDMTEHHETMSRLLLFTHNLLTQDGIGGSSCARLAARDEIHRFPSCRVVGYVPPLDLMSSASRSLPSSLAAIS